MLRPTSAALLCLATSACFRYVETVRPLTAEDCPPEPPHGFFRVHSVASQNNLITGRVTDAAQPDTARAGLAVALLRVAGSDVVTDTSGHFQLTLPAGRHVLRTLRIGFSARTDTLIFDDRSTVTIDIGLEPAPFDGCPGFMSLVTRERRWRWPW